MKVRVGLSAFMGVLFAVPWYFVFDFIDLQSPFILAVATGGLFACFLLVYFIIHQKYTESKYEKAEKNITSPVFFKANGNFNLCGKVKNCNIYFCDNGIVFLCLEKGKVSAEEISSDVLQSVLTDSISKMNIHTTDGRLYVITTPDARRINDELMKRPDWLNK